MDATQEADARNVLTEIKADVAAALRFITNQAARLKDERWHVPRFGLGAIIRLNAFGCTVDEAFNIARRWPDATWKREDFATLVRWYGDIDGVRLVLDHVTGDQPVANGDLINFRPSQGDEGSEV